MTAIWIIPISIHASPRWFGPFTVTFSFAVVRDTRLHPDLAVEPWDEELLRRLADNQDYWAALELLGYEHPDLPREHFLGGAAADDVLSPADVRRVFEEGNRLSAARRWEAAVRCYQRVLDREPNHWAALNNIGHCLNQLKKYDWAALQLQRAVALHSNAPLALANLVTALEEGGRRFEAVTYLRRLQELEPNAANHAFRLSNVLVSLGRVPEALFYCRRVLELQPQHYGAACNYLLYSNYSDQETVESVAAEHFRVAQKWSRPACRAPAAFVQSHEAERRLRIGYVSRDFYTHPVGKLIQPMIAAHDRELVEVYCYYDGDKHDVWTERTEAACASFQKTRPLKDAELELRILNDAVDILVDLGGYTSGGNRLNVFAAGAAPVQVAFLGYPNTTGLTAMDYRLTDAYCDPPGQTERWHSEKLIRLQHGFLCYQPPDELPPPGPSPATKNGYVTFGSLNNIAKISESALAAWADILRRVPDSRLTFKYGDRYQSEVVCERIKSVFAHAAIDPARLRFLPSQPSLQTHLQTLAQVDLALDSFPYQGTMTTLETLAMSVPVITLCGQTYSRRASSALLLRLGLNDLVAESRDEYVDLAVALANNPPLLDDLRGGLRERFLSSEVCDVAGFVRELEATYRRVWREWCTKFPAT
jgi:predicted O-linked N-acetylglucosamine transferase (SPINDLY family)